MSGGKPGRLAGARNVLKESHDGPRRTALSAVRLSPIDAEAVEPVRTRTNEPIGARQASERTQPCRNDRPALGTRLITVRDLESVATRR